MASALCGHALAAAATPSVSADGRYLNSHYLITIAAYRFMHSNGSAQHHAFTHAPSDSRILRVSMWHRHETTLQSAHSRCAVHFSQITMRASCRGPYHDTGRTSRRQLGAYPGIAGIVPCAYARGTARAGT
jgi:hypothetical protein